MGTIAKLKTGNDTHLIASTCYGTCSTAADTAAKVATIQDSQAFTLITGVTVHIKFTYSNSIANPTLNVNSTGAKSIKRYGTTAPGTSATQSWYANSVVSFTYDGTYWMMNDFKYDTNTNTTYTFAKGDNNATIKVTPSGSDPQNVLVKGVPHMELDGSHAALIPIDANDAESNSLYVKIGKSGNTKGLIPCQSGVRGSGHQVLGTSGWFWKEMYVDRINKITMNSSIVGLSGKISNSTNLWFKVANYTFAESEANYDIVSLVAVYDNYSTSRSGIFRLRFRTGKTGTQSVPSDMEMKWLSNSGYDPLDFYVTCSASDTVGPTYELWTQIKEDYNTRTFTVLNESLRSSLDYTKITWNNKYAATGDAKDEPGTLPVQKQSIDSNRWQGAITINSTARLICSNATSYNEVKIVATGTVSGVTISIPLVVAISDIPDSQASNPVQFRAGYYQSGTSGGELAVTLYINNNEVYGQLNLFWINGSQPSGSTIIAQYR